MRLVVLTTVLAISASSLVHGVPFEDLSKRDDYSPCTFNAVSPPPPFTVCNGVGNLTRPRLPVIKVFAETVDSCRDSCFNFGTNCLSYSYCSPFFGMCLPVGQHTMYGTPSCNLYNTTLELQGFKSNASTNFQFSSKRCSNATCPSTSPAPAPPGICPLTFGRFRLRASGSNTTNDGSYAYLGGRPGNELHLNPNPSKNGFGNDIFYFGVLDGFLYSQSVDPFYQIPYASYDGDDSENGNPLQFYGEYQRGLNAEIPVRCGVGKNNVLQCQQPFYLYPPGSDQNPQIAYGMNRFQSGLIRFNLTAVCAYEF